MLRHLRVHLVVSSFALAFLAGCPHSPPSDDGGTDAGCEGTIGCACAAGSCSAGECVAGTCTDCKRGEAACVCRSNSTCNTGLVCGTASICQTCTAGAEGCACAAGDSCTAGLRCEGAVCVVDSCVAGSAGCPCRAGDPKCDGSSYCDGTSRCQACAPDVAGCPCGASNVCTGGLLCDVGAMTCRVPKTCAQLGCAPHQTCTEGSAGADATCVGGSCEPQYKWDSRSSACVACVSTDCAAEPSCSDDGGVSADWATQNRICVQAGQVASCGACASGFTEPRADAGVSGCVVAPLCGSATCTVDQFCDNTNGPPVCAALPCPVGQARAYDFGTNSYGACAACNRQCNGVGFTGRIWPYQSHLGECLCETLPGFFVPQGVNGQAVVCDADHDGWVRSDADDPTVRNDPALKANSRCAILQVNAVRLVDEYGSAALVSSCAEGLLLQPDAGACSSFVPMRLLETARNDVGGVNAAKLPQYGAAGRTLEPNEINALTKACVSLSADFNDNGVDDIREVQGRQVTATDDQLRLASFAYFLELYDAWYEPGTPSGTLVIHERSRCGSAFPLRYDFTITDPTSGADAYAASSAQTYWRNCARKRDSKYSQSSTEPGYDFAQWDCAANAGTCPTLPPARADGGVGPNPDPRLQLVRDFGLCELKGALPADQVWRGFTHHSQFKCVNVTSTPANAFDHAQGDFAASNATTNDKLVFNQCFAQPCSGPSCRSSPGTGLQTAAPTVHCLAASPPAGAVGFAAVGFHGYAASGAYTAQTYVNGCLAEDEETRTAITIPGASGPTAVRSYLCPYPEYCNTLFNDGTCSGAVGRADPAFGRYSCYGTLANFLWCDGPPANPQRATLRWATGPSDTANGFLR
jgi:hypothetical protein